MKLSALPWCLAATILAGCSTPAPIKTLGQQTQSGVATLADYYDKDIEVAGEHIAALKSAVLTLEAQAKRERDNARKAAEAWKASAQREIRLRVLALWDQRVLNMLSTEFETVVETAYYKQINVRLDLLRADFLTKKQAADAAPGNALLKFETTLAALRMAEQRHRAGDRLLVLISDFHRRLITARADLIKELQLPAFDSVPPPAPPQLDHTAIAPLAIDRNDAALKQLAARREQVRAFAKAHTEGSRALNFYLESDGYRGLLAQEAVKGFAQKVVDAANLPGAIGKLSNQLGLSDDLTAKLTELAKSGTDQLLDDVPKELSATFTTHLTNLESRFQRVVQDFTAKLSGSAPDQTAATQ